MNYFKHNLAILQKNRPDILPLLRQPKVPLDSKLTFDDDNTQNLPAFFSDFQEKDEDEFLIFLVGIGLDSEAKQIADNAPQARIVILEPSAERFSIALQQEDHTALLSSPNVALHIGPDINIPQILTQEDDALRALDFRLVANKKLQELQPDLYLPLYSELQKALLNFKGKVQTIVKQGPLLLTNTLNNSAQLKNTAHIKTLTNLAKDRPVICVAAGPSLTKNIEQLKGQKDYFFIIVVDSAAKVLIDHGIIPHAIVTIDPIKLSLVKLQDVIAHHPDIPLISTPEAYPETITGFTESPKFIIPGVNDLFRLYFAPLLGDATIFANMVSVSHAATQVASTLGANTLIFMGLDLALNGKQDHVSGCPVSWGKFGPDDRISIPGFDGKPVETVPVLQNQLTELQELISRHQEEMVFIDATEGGALIQGSSPMPLKKALQQFKPTKADYATALHDRFRNAQKPDSKQIKNSLKKLKKDLKQSLKIANTGLRSGKEARLNWKLSKIPKKRSQALKKFRKSTIVSGNNFDKMMDLLDLTIAIYPLRAHDHHQFIYARKKFNETVESKTEEEKIFDELDQNMDYFQSWIATVKRAEKIIAEAEKNIL